MASLSVVIPATDSRQTSVHCLQAIRRAHDAPDEVIVVDRPASLGPAAARNVGARQASADIVVFVDSDIEVHPDAFDRIREAFASDPDLTAVFGSYDDDPGADGAVSGFRNLLHHHVHHRGSGPATTFWAGLGAIRRDDFLAVGGFDEHRYSEPSVEDIELGMRLVRAGKRITLDPTIQGSHLKAWTLGSMVRTDLFRRGAPWVQLLLEYGAGSTTLNLGWRHRVSAVASLACVSAVLARKPMLVGAAITVLIVLNGDFYVLLYRKRGAVPTVVALPLHVLHHLVSIAAVPVGVSRYVLTRVARG